MTRTVEGYLSRLAGQVWPGALVYHEPDEDRYLLERPDLTPVQLGNDEGWDGARNALKALIRAHRQQEAAT